MSTLDVVAEVLREVAPRALKAKQIAQLAKGRLLTESKTPETVVSRDLALDVKKLGPRSRFMRVDRGAFVLKEALTRALYNDNEPYVATWTKNLISAGEIAPGVVDERSIRDLKPADVASYRQFHAFSGIGIWSRALRDAGIPDDANVWTGSCPCQGWSQAGRKKGFEDERHLWPDWFRLISACRPALIFGEQVSSKDGLAWVDLVRLQLENANYAFRILDTPAASVGAPHKRQRFYFVAYARERGREILSASWIYDRGQCRNHIARRGAADDSTPGAISDAERVVWNEGRTSFSHGRAEIESDGHREAHGESDWGGSVRGFWSHANWIYCRPAPGHQNGSFRPAEPILIKVSDGDFASVGPLRPEEIGDVDSSKTDASQVLRGLWQENGAETIREDLGVFERLQAAEVLRSALHGKWDGGANKSSECPELATAEREAGGEVLFPMRSFGYGTLRSPCGRESAEQRPVEPEDLVRLVSSSLAFAQYRSDNRTAEALQSLLKACGTEWLVRRPSYEAAALWRSLPDAHKGRFFVGLGRFRRASIPPLLSKGKVDNRAARLRGYGNAIVLPQAVEFVGAVIDSFADAARAQSQEHAA